MILWQREWRECWQEVEVENVEGLQMLGCCGRDCEGVVGREVGTENSKMSWQLRTNANTPRSAVKTK